MLNYDVPLGKCPLQEQSLFFIEKNAALRGFFFSAAIGTFGFLFFFLSCGSQKAPDHARTRKSHFLFGKSTISEMHVLLSSVLIDEFSKISENRPEMAREDTEG